MFGVLPINKPAGITSRDAVNQVQRIVRPIKVGHTGTLDPLATGVLLVAVGPATRLTEFAHSLPKSYEADFELGLESDTLDTDGDIVRSKSDVQPKGDEIALECQRWVGRIEQVPPKFSAIHVDGRRAYELARRGEEVELQPRPVEVHAIDVLDYSFPKLTMHILCGTGTYIRSLGRDIAYGVGTTAVMSRLVRTAIGPFDLPRCVALEKLTDSKVVEEHLLPPEMLLESMPVIQLKMDESERIRNGRRLSFPNQVTPHLAAVDEHGKLAAVLERMNDRGLYRSLRVFQQTTAVAQPNKIKTPHKPES